MNAPNDLTEICKKYRRELFEKFLEVGQGHPGSVFSMLEIVVTLYYKNFIRFDKDLKKFKDKIIISKGHAAVALYPILKDFGIIPEKEWDNWGKGRENSILRVFLQHIYTRNRRHIWITGSWIGNCLWNGVRF